MVERGVVSHSIHPLPWISTIYLGSPQVLRDQLQTVGVLNYVYLQVGEREGNDDGNYDGVPHNQDILGQNKVS